MLEGTGAMGMSLLRMLIIVGLGMTPFTASAVAQTPAIDGLFDEWSDDTLIASDRGGDSLLTPLAHAL